MSYRLSRRAVLEISRTERWWRQHRPAAPEAFVDEIADALEQIVREPHSGAPWGSQQHALVRRVLLPKTQRFVYYLLEGDVILVLSVRGTQRGAGPRFRRRLP